ncbi:hypothetical protein AWB77_01495 [Caballeronia fortuita]|uniref:Uncharacterized protein n=1 Tax=Caballeronia fortuita TaxID=1777138 RepID=A0A158A891_9BURK|nr:hypothetical protein [Caballeronia fortuita]SAK54041.1 hypothetical protein AWB77_01495 [Caballeronia fortuita]
MDDGFAAFERRVRKAAITLPDRGYFEFAATLVGDIKPELQANKNLLNLITSANRRFGGYPYFSVLHGADLPERRPRLVEDTWEQAVIQPAGTSWDMKTIDFWRIEATGRFYALRAYDEDLDDNLKPLCSFAIVLPVWRSADAIIEALAIAREFATSVEESKLAIRLRWSKLEGRTLSNAYSNRFWPVRAVAHDDVATSSFELPLDLPDSAVGARVAEALSPLYRKFDGFELPENIVTAEVEKLMAQLF